jgi:hypothetical protein
VRAWAARSAKRLPFQGTRFREDDRPEWRFLMLVLIIASAVLTSAHADGAAAFSWMTDRRLRALP